MNFRNTRTLVFDHDGSSFCVLALPGKHVYEIVLYKNGLRVFAVGQISFSFINDGMNCGSDADPLIAYMEHVRWGVMTIRSG